MKKVLLASVTAFSIFTLISCGGSSNEPSTAQSTPAAAPAAAPASSGPVSGEAVYKKTCFACHQLDGKGVPSTFPPLAKSDFIADREKTIGQVIKGKSGELIVNGNKFNNTMPPQPLSDEEIAAVLTYVYSNFGNSGAPVTVDEVKAVRAKL